jgi:hypothetical protein
VASLSRFGKPLRHDVKHISPLPEPTGRAGKDMNHNLVTRNLTKQVTNLLGKDLVNNIARCCVHAADDPLLTSNVIKENNPVSLDPQPAKSLEFSFEFSDISFLSF